MKRFSRPIYLKCAIVFVVNFLGFSFHRLSPAVSRFAVYSLAVEVQKTPHFNNQQLW